MLTFFPEIDENKTIKQAERKLKEYKKWLRRFGDVRSQKITQTYTFEPRSTANPNSSQVEDIVARRDEAERELQAIEDAVNNIWDTDQRILLVERYLKVGCEKTKDYEIYDFVLHVSHTAYYEMRCDALLAFAELYRHGILQVEKEV